MKKLILCSLILLSGCTGQPPEIQIHVIKPPVELLTCSPMPEAPASDSVDAHRRWATQVFFALRDCKAKLLAIQEFINQ